MKKFKKRYIIDYNSVELLMKIETTLMALFFNAVFRINCRFDVGNGRYLLKKI